MHLYLVASLPIYRPVKEFYSSQLLTWNGPLLRCQNIKLGQHRRFRSKYKSHRCLSFWTEPGSSSSSSRMTCNKIISTIWRVHHTSERIIYFLIICYHCWWWWLCWCCAKNIYFGLCHTSLEFLIKTLGSKIWRNRSAMVKRFSLKLMTTLCIPGSCEPSYLKRCKCRQVSLETFLFQVEWVTFIRTGYNNTTIDVSGRYDLWYVITSWLVMVV